jgi:hypothetical protein
MSNPRKPVTPDVVAVVRLLTEQGPLMGEEVANLLGWPADRWWKVVASRGAWFELTGKGWVLTDEGKAAVAE